MPWSKADAVRYLQDNARPSSQSRCAEYTRRAIEAGGLRIAHTAHAKDYGSSLIRAGIREVHGTPQRGRGSYTGHYGSSVRPHGDV
ncbi:hypothetical protein HDG35_001558 [Paraburkholderia sp. JPY681]|nr:hypothetical protein [Paraburkholderia atlantica]